jgi:hypothetical protein
VPRKNCAELSKTFTFRKASLTQLTFVTKGLMTKKKSPPDSFLEFLEQQAAEVKNSVSGSVNNKTVDSLVKQRLFTGELKKIYGKMPAALPYRGKRTKKTERILNVMLSDLHYGADLKEAECASSYGALEESRRTAAVVLAVADWKLQYRSETSVTVHLLGDLIEGKLHDPQSAAPMTEQFNRAIWNLHQAIRFLASEFKSVQVCCVAGNHGRIKERHSGRAVNQKWDSFENMIYTALKFSLSSTKNVSVDIPLTPYYYYQAFDKHMFMTHGDTVLNIGYPNRAINVEGVRRQVNEINEYRRGRNEPTCDLFGAGHVHVASATRLPSGPVLVSNGALIPSGEYGQSIGIMSSVCSQQIWESVPGIVYGHRMDVLLNEDTDKNSSLDRIIKPYTGNEKFGADSISFP